LYILIFKFACHPIWKLISPPPGILGDVCWPFVAQQPMYKSQSCLTSKQFLHTLSTLLCYVRLTKDRPGLSSERSSHRDRATNSRPKLMKRKEYLVKRPQSGLNTKTYWLTDWLTDWLTVRRKVTLTLTNSF
jgi:hypothetical protein